MIFPSREQHANLYFEYLTWGLLMEYLLFENFARSAFVKSWDPKKNYFFRGFWRFFLKSTQNLKLQQCPSEDLKVLLLGLSSLTVKPSQIQQNLAIAVQIPSDRFYRQIYSPRATWCDCANFYLKWLRATPKLATSIWTNRLNIFYLSVLKYILPFWHFSQQVLTSSFLGSITAAITNLQRLLGIIFSCQTSRHTSTTVTHAHRLFEFIAVHLGCAPHFCPHPSDELTCSTK